MLRTAEELILPMGEESRKRWVCLYRRATLYFQSKTERVNNPVRAWRPSCRKRFPVHMENTASSSTGTSSLVGRPGFNRESKEVCHEQIHR
jgi:hypothetical protein